MATGNSEKITAWVDPKDKTGEFKRGQSVFRDAISKSPGAKYAPEKDRYHLYISYACPWAHRTLIVRKLKGLEEIIPYTCVHWHMGDKGPSSLPSQNSTSSRELRYVVGWRFAKPDEDVPGENVTPDPLHEGFTHLRDIYFKVDPEYKGRFTVPTLYDKKTGTIVNNESSEIIRMFYSEFDDLLEEKYRKVVLYPEDLRDQIEDMNTWVYNDINNGVYKSGFATTEEAYTKAVTTLFEALDKAEEHKKSSSGKYLFGDRLTEADIRLYTTIVRFDVVYVQHFKCNIRDIRSGYPHLHDWLRRLYWEIPAFKETTDFYHIKQHYTKSHTQINQHSITPLGPVPDILPLDEEVPAVKYALEEAQGVK
ncbi:MAG: hypothetical protein M1823_001951 [Watsoniomyces obsoletus]|nr:MAG: hypothetical protein M1823_001951 [Watsoniomyces obsoletus]